jgi:hypothetical protein
MVRTIMLRLIEPDQADKVVGLRTGEQPGDLRFAD